jgi:hypothetical protein
MATNQWFVRGGGKVYGPLDAARLKQLASEGKVDRKTDIATNAAGPWQPAGNVKGLFPQASTNEADKAATPPAPVAAAIATSAKPRWYRQWWAIFVVYPILALFGCGVVIQLTVPKETLDRWKAEADERGRKQAEKRAAEKTTSAKVTMARARGEDAGHQAGFLWARVGKRKPERSVLEAAAALEAEKAIPSNTALNNSGSDAERQAYARGYSRTFSEGYDKAN